MLTSTFAAAFLMVASVPAVVSLSDSGKVEASLLTGEDAAVVAAIASRYAGEMKPYETWTANSGTNGISVFVCTDVQTYNNEPMYLFRDFRFSADGRLQSISHVCHATRIMETHHAAKPSVNPSRKKTINGAKNGGSENGRPRASSRIHRSEADVFGADVDDLPCL